VPAVAPRPTVSEVPGAGQKGTAATTVAAAKAAQPEAKPKEEPAGKVELRKEAAGLGLGVVGGADTPLVSTCITKTTTLQSLL
jgi:hypothetical protein